MNPEQPAPKRYILKGTPQSSIVTLRGISPTFARLGLWLSLPVLAAALLSAAVPVMQWRANESIEEIGLAITATLLLLSLPVTICSLWLLKKPNRALVVDRDRRAVTVLAYRRKIGELGFDEIGEYETVMMRAVKHIHREYSHTTRTSVSKHPYLVVKSHPKLGLYGIIGARDRNRFIATLEYLVGKRDRQGRAI